MDDEEEPMSGNAMESGGRNAHFYGGVFEGHTNLPTVQQNVNPSWQPRSVLNQLRRSGNGFGTSEKDQSRLLIGDTFEGSVLPTSNGMSQSNYQHAPALLHTGRPII